MKFNSFLQMIALSILVLGISSKDNSTLSNYLEVQQTKLEGIMEIDFENKLVNGNIELSFKALKAGNKVILDTKHLAISKITDESGTELEYQNGEESETLGLPLIITYEYQEADEFKIKFEYTTTEEGTSAQFLTKEQTEGKEYPYFYTQGALTRNRELFPIQDTPAVKMPVDLGIKVKKPFVGLESGIFQNSTENDDETRTFYYSQKVPIPSYLIAIAAGNIDSETISDKVKVFAEPEILQNAAVKLGNILTFMDIVVDYLGEYEWGEYNILVLPTPFPISSMENPTLTFVSPFLIAGDNSLDDVMIYELIHSWIGNLVTNENWADCWLTKGIAQFLERKISGIWRKDEDYAKLDAILGLSYLKDAIDLYGEDSTYTALHPNLTDTNPDDVYSDLPYEKGFNFMYYLETLINNASGAEADLMKYFLRSYINEYKKKSVDVNQFKDYFIGFMKNNSISDEVLAQIDWQNWIYDPGYPKVQNNFTNKYSIQVDNAIEKFYQGKLDEELKNEFNSWQSLLKTVFLLQIDGNEIEFTDEQQKFLSNDLNLKEGQSSVVTNYYFRAILFRTNKFLEGEEESLKDYLGKYGVLDYMSGLYYGYYLRDKEAAVKTYDSLKNFYHASFREIIEEEFEYAEAFPFISIKSFADSQEKCVYMPLNTEIYLKIEGIDESLGDIKIEENIFLSKNDSNDIPLDCTFNSSSAICKTSKVLDKSGEYFISVPRKIQTSTYIIKPITIPGTIKGYKYEIKIDESKTAKKKDIDYSKTSVQNLEITFTTEPTEKVALIESESKKEIACTTKGLVMTCPISNEVLQIDEKNPNNAKSYSLKIFNYCGNEVFNVDITVKGTPTKDKGTEDNEGSSTTLIIVLVVIIVLIIAGIVAFLIIRSKKKSAPADPSVEIPKTEIALVEKPE